jgi:hypothetical protein
MYYYGNTANIVPQLFCICVRQAQFCANYRCDSVKDSRVADSIILVVAKEHKVAGSFSSSLLPLNQRKPTGKVCIKSKFHRQLDVQISSDLVDSYI